MFKLNYFSLYVNYIDLFEFHSNQLTNLIQDKCNLKHFPPLVRAFRQGAWLGIVFEGYIPFSFAFGGTRRQKGGKNAAVIGWKVVSFLVEVQVNSFPGLGTVVSLVSMVVVFTGPRPAAEAGCSGGE